MLENYILIFIPVIIFTLLFFLGLLFTILKDLERIDSVLENICEIKQDYIYILDVLVKIKQEINNR